MFSLCPNCCIKLSRHEKKSRNNKKIKPFIDQYNWKDRKFPWLKKDWKKFELNNKSICLKILCVPYNTKGRKHAYKLSHNLKHKNEIILLMITNGIILLPKVCLNNLEE